MSNTNRRTFYQNIQVNNSGLLKVSEIHSIFWEESGKADGLPALVLHGGPGAGLSPIYRGFFDPTVYRIVQFDQRGCGQSTPFGCLQENTTQDLIADIEKLRVHLGIEKWHVSFGGSWGATLSVAYAEAHPDRVSHQVLRGVFLSRKWELDHLYKNGTSLIFPEEFSELQSHLPIEEQGDCLHYYYKRLTSDTVSQEEKIKLAIAWTKYELQASKLYPCEKLIALAEDVNFSLGLGLIETHYLEQICFFRNDNQMIEDAHLIKDIPTVIVQGRYDVLCPMKSAWELHKALPKSELVIVPDAGHSCTEDGIVHELVTATDKFKITS